MARRTTTILERPRRRLTQGELDNFLDKAADILRGNVDHSEFRGYVFALLFFKRINDVYLEELRNLTERTGDAELARDPRMHNFVVPEDVLWEKVATKSRNDLGTALNEAMIAIERANQPKFDGILTNKIDFNKSDELPREKLINLINHFRGQPFDHAHVSNDVFGNAYEHLIRNFASKAGKSSGEFYTPAEVASLMAEIIEPEEGHSVCDWASGSGGLLLQSRNYVRRHGGDPDRLLLYAQESNMATYNISRINMILHGVKGWTHQRDDSIRVPLLLDEGNRLLKFDRVVMNPPFSLEDWGYNELVGGDPHQRFLFGMPPRDNGDYAWLQQVVASLKDDGRAIVVMSQGVLFRGRPEQTEEEDGRRQKADAEWMIRHGFLEADLIECVIVLPSKLFYGNNVPACLVVLNKNKPSTRKGRILLIWASRHFKKANPQNILRPSDLMRILVPWRAYGNLEVARSLVAEHEAVLIIQEETERDRRLQDIEDAYAPLLEEAPALKAELAALEASPFTTWKGAPDGDHPFFGTLVDLTSDMAALRTATANAKKAYTDRVRELKRSVKDLSKLQAERDQQEKEVAEEFDREITHVREAAADLLRICSDQVESRRYFVVAERAEIEENEFSLNVPRYVMTFEPEEPLSVDEARIDLAKASDKARDPFANLLRLLEAEVSSLGLGDGRETKIGMLPASWDVQPLRALLAEPPLAGTSPSDTRADPPGVPTLNVACIRDGRCTTDKQTYIDVGEDTVGRYRVRCGDFFVVRGNGNVDLVAAGGLLVDEPVEATIYSDLLIRLRFNSETEPGFVPWLWTSKAFVQRLQAKAKTGSGLWKIGQRDQASPRAGSSKAPAEIDSCGA
jgi:type I restriction enzyme M protein